MILFRSRPNRLLFFLIAFFFLRFFFLVWSNYSPDAPAGGSHGESTVYHEISAMRDRFHWTHLLAYVTGLVNQELLLRNEYLAAEDHIFRAGLPSRFRLSDPERSTLAEIAKRLGRNALKDMACAAKPDTILAWYRRLVAQKFDPSSAPIPAALASHRRWRHS